jgi:hypothetical protein
LTDRAVVTSGSLRTLRVEETLTSRLELSRYVRVATPIDSLIVSVSAVLDNKSGHLRTRLHAALVVPSLQSPLAVRLKPGGLARRIQRGRGADAAWLAMVQVPSQLRHRQNVDTVITFASVSKILLWQNGHASGRAAGWVDGGLGIVFLGVFLGIPRSVNVHL